MVSSSLLPLKVYAFTLSATLRRKSRFPKVAWLLILAGGFEIILEELPWPIETWMLLLMLSPGMRDYLLVSFESDHYSFWENHPIIYYRILLLCGEGDSIFWLLLNCLEKFSYPILKSGVSPDIADSEQLSF